MTMYQKAVIYKLVCNDLNIKDIYVGSTCNFTRRKYGHKTSCNNEKSLQYNLSVYQCIRNNGGWVNWGMIMIEQYSCEDKRQLEKRERFWIESLKPTLNKNIPTRTIKEYNKDNREKISDQQKEYYEKNKGKLSEKQKEYREKNKEKNSEYGKDWRYSQMGKDWRLKNKEKNSEYGKEYREKNKEKNSEKKKEWYEKNKEKLAEKKKEYYEKNKEKISEKHKEYREKNKEKNSEYGKEYREKNKEILSEKKKEWYEKNKEEINKKMKEKYTCICGSTISKNSKNRHEKSIKHKNFIESQNE